MRIQTDSFCTTGLLHQICQDYCLHAPKQIVLSDGCSSAELSDFGSRLFCIEYLNSEYDDNIYVVADKVLNDLDLLKLPQEAGFATLFAVSAKSNGFLAKSLGDGYIAGKKHSGEIVIKSYSYSENMPWYPLYNALGYEARIMPETNKFIEDNEEMDITYGMIPQMTLFDYHTYHTVAIFSDGVDTFQDKNGKLCLEDTIDKLMKFPLYNGEFVQRRCIKQLKEWKEQGFINYDDFSMAAIHLEVEDV